MAPLGKLLKELILCETLNARPSGEFIEKRGADEIYVEEPPLKGTRGGDMDPGQMTPRKVSLQDIMRPAVSVTPDTPARAVLKVLSENRMPGVPVVDANGRLVGFVSDGHLLASALPRYLSTIEDLSFIRESGDAWVHYLAESADRPVSEVMSSEVSSVELGKSEVAVAHKMVHDGASSVMVTQSGKLIGIVNRLDLYAAVMGIEVEKSSPDER